MAICCYLDTSVPENVESALRRLLISTILPARSFRGLAGELVLRWSCAEGSAIEEPRDLGR